MKSESTFGTMFLLALLVAKAFGYSEVSDSLSLLEEPEPDDELPLSPELLPDSSDDSLPDED